MQSRCQTQPEYLFPLKSLNLLLSISSYDLSCGAQDLYFRTGRVWENLCTLLDVPLQFYANLAKSCQFLAVSAPPQRFWQGARDSALEPYTGRKSNGKSFPALSAMGCLAPSSDTFE